MTQWGAQHTCLNPTLSQDHSKLTLDIIANNIKGMFYLFIDCVVWIVYYIKNMTNGIMCCNYFLLNLGNKYLVSHFCVFNNLSISISGKISKFGEVWFLQFAEPSFSGWPHD